MKKTLLIIAVTLFAAASAYAQNPVQVGKGSYAEYVPFFESVSSDHGGCKAYYMEHRDLYITDRMKGKPIPSNDWWTDLIVSQYSGNLWAYPQMVSAMSTGVHIEFPSYWEPNGNEVKSKSHINVGASKFYPESASADDWHDWGFRFLMQDGAKSMNVTLAHGMPFTWVECEGITPYLQFDKATFIVNGVTTKAPFEADAFVVQIDGDNYGIYAPAGTRFVNSDGRLEARFSGSREFLVVAVLPSADDLSAYKPYAYNVPRDTKVTWKYAANEGKLKTYWNVTAENLNGGAGTDVLQGFIPHHYKRSTMSFSFMPQTYLTPRGTMKMAAGHSFEIDYDYNGILPFYPEPQANAALANPYQRDRMVELIADYASKGTFGGDTYWGGKGLTQMAHYMCFAYEMGEMELFETCKKRLKAMLIDWLTYTPGEQLRYFAHYPVWGAYVGFDPSYDSDTFNDHHFHYGYYTYSSALLAMFDEDFRNNYGEMISLVARDYANWDRTRTDVPFFRTFDPWCGHSFAGGVGGGGGNGQESTSEAMQGWGGMLLLGAALGNDDMRDAGIFGYVLEARGTAEYWFDRDRTNIDYTKYNHPWSTNLTTQGVGWWTWFSGDPLWMHSIQWLPISPILKYLYEDLTFAEWDYNQMYAKKETPDWTETNGLGSQSGVGNVCLSYLQIFNPDEAAKIFDQLWDGNFAVAKNPDTGGITYFITHMHRTYGEIQWNIHADMPLSTAYYNAAQNKYYYVVYNASDTEKSVAFYKDGTAKVSFKAPANKLTVYSDTPVLTSIEISAPTTVARSSKTQLKAVAYDQYGATYNGAITWTSTSGTITDAGLFTAPATNGTVTVTAKSGALNAQKSIKINDAVVLTTAEISPSAQYTQVGTDITASAILKDQYGDEFIAPHTWEISCNGTVITTDSAFSVSQCGTYTIKVTAAGKSFTSKFIALPSYPNIALGKTCTVSSAEGANTASKASDGNNSTRWESQQGNDDEWIYVNLDKQCYISAVGIRWEAAFAAKYDIQISNNGTDWTTLATETGANGLVVTSLDVNAQYVRIACRTRATQYGYSVFEFEVYGIDPDTDKTKLFGMDILPNTSIITERENLQLSAKGYNLNGVEVATNATWAVEEGNATISATGLLTPTSYGNITVSATANGIKATKSLYASEVIAIKEIKLEPEAAYLIKGQTQYFTAVAYDQFGTRIDEDLKFTYTMTGTGSTFKDGLFTAGANGNYQITATYGGISGQATISVDNFSNINLALHKKTSCSSYEDGGTLPSNVTDGDYTSRWASTFKNGEYIVVDLEDYYNINDIKIFWQEAYATEYHIEVSMDEERWTKVYSTSTCAGGDEDIAIDEIAARYIRVTADKRYNAAWGASIREIEVYGTSSAEAPRATTIQIMPPYTFYIGTQAQFEVKVFNQYGTEMKQDPTPAFAVTGGGTINDYGLFTPTTAGEYKLEVNFNNEVFNNCKFTVKEKQVLTTIVVVPEATLTTVGSEINVTAIAYDQYGNQMDAVFAWSSTLGTISNDGVFSSATQGTATIEATANGKKGSNTIKVIGELTTNLALNKPATASSGTASAAVDGNLGSRWESAHKDNEWIYVDLQDIYQLTSFQIIWETASASDYRIQVSNNATDWITILEVNGKQSENNRLDEAAIGGAGRYVRIYCDHRSTNWGNSIYELRLYGVALEAGIPYSIEFVNPATDIQTRKTYNYTVAVKDKNGTTLAGQTVVWSATGGSITASGAYMASETGEQTITAAIGNVKSELKVNATMVTDIAENVSSTTRCHLENDILYVTGSNLASTRLYDLAGRAVTDGDTSNDESRINVQNLHGVYLVLITYNDNTRTVVKVNI